MVKMPYVDDRPGSGSTRKRGLPTGLVPSWLSHVRRRLAAAWLLFLLSFSIPGTGHALDLGLTPNHVYGLWLNINSVFLTYHRTTCPDRTLVDRLDVMQPRHFVGKTPADVYARAGALRARAFGWDDDPPTPVWITDFQVLEGDEARTEVTPSMVFVLSSQILNGLVDDFAEATDGTQPVSRFYVDNKVTGKRPSDVFGLVDLLDRRLETSLSSRNTAPSTTMEGPAACSLH